MGNCWIGIFITSIIEKILYNKNNKKDNITLIIKDVKLNNNINNSIIMRKRETKKKLIKELSY
jgi:hypothetical protein